MNDKQQQPAAEDVDEISMHEIALAAMTGLLANPYHAENPAAAAHLAWTHCVPAYLQGMQQQMYIAQQMADAAAQQAKG